MEQRAAPTVIVHIPALLQQLTGYAERVELDWPAGEPVSVRRLLAEVERRYPGIEARLLDQGELIPGIAVFVDGEQAGLGLREKVRPPADIHFIPPVVGGR